MDISKAFGFLLELPIEHKLLLLSNVAVVLFVVVVVLIGIFILLKIRDIKKVNEKRIEEYIRQKCREIYRIASEKLRVSMVVKWQTIGVCSVEELNTPNCKHLPEMFADKWGRVKSELRHILVDNNSQRTIDATHQNGYIGLTQVELELKIKERGETIFYEAQEELIDAGIYDNKVVIPHGDNRFTVGDAIDFHRMVVNFYISVKREEKKQIANLFGVPKKVLNLLK